MSTYSFTYYETKWFEMNNVYVDITTGTVVHLYEIQNEIAIFRKTINRFPVGKILVLPKLQFNEEYIELSKLGWQPIEKLTVEMLNEAKQLHCDTRDFCAILSETEPENKDDYGQQIPKVSEQQLVTSEKLIEFLKYCKQISGGEGERRMFSTLKSNWDLKYIRWFKYLDKWIVCNKDRKLIDIAKINPDNIEETHCH